MSMRGKIEHLRQNRIIGWIFDESQPDTPIEFSLFLNQISLGDCRADRFRGDLKAKNVGNGVHSFRFPIDDIGVISVGDQISARPVGGGELLIPPMIVTREMLSAPELDTGRATPVRKAGGDWVYDVAPPPLGAKTLPSPAPKPAFEPDSQSRLVRSDLVVVPPQKLAKDLKGLGPSFRPVRTVAPKIKGFSDAITPEDVIAFTQFVLTTTGANEKNIVSVIESLFNSARYNLLTSVVESLPGPTPLGSKVRGLYGRALLQQQRYGEAAHFFKQVCAAEPERHGMQYYLGIAYARMEQWQDALETFETCVRLCPEDEPKYHMELGRVLMRLSFGAYGPLPEKRELLPRALSALETAVRLDQKSPAPCRDLAQLYVHLGRIEDALTVAQLATERGPKDLGSWVELTRVSLRARKIDIAQKAAREAQKIAPSNDTVKFNMRVVSRLAESMRLTEVATLCVYDSVCEEESGGDWGQWLADQKDTFVLFDPEEKCDRDAARRLVESAGHEWAGRIIDAGQPGLAIWRCDLLRLLIGADVVYGRQPPGQLGDKIGRLVRTSDATQRLIPDLSSTRPEGGTAVLISRFGINKFGGAEHFLQQMALLYQGMGYKALVVGVQPERVGDSGEVDGLRYRFIEPTPEDYVRLMIEENAVLCHTLSGMALDVTFSLRHLDIDLVHGVHFWRDMMAAPTPNPGYYPDAGSIAPTPRDEFKAVIRDSGAIYANSGFTRAQIEPLFGMSAPVIFSLPDPVSEDEGGHGDPADRDFVLLANARHDKGFGLILEVARRLPHIHFKTLSTQSSRDIALAAIADAGVSNVELLAKVDDMGALYRKARVVAVPSYKFVETFSRVVIEGHRYGVPVIGSDKGNVPYLLTESGVSLPEDPHRWAQEIERLFSDQSYWMQRSEAALANSERYSFEMQAGRLQRIVSALKSPLLIGVGSGLGNIIHTAPMIRNIALRTGRPVDVVMAGDHTDMLFLLANREYVNHAFVLNDEVLNRQYDTVFLTSCFGSATPRFASNRVLYSRNWREFRPGEGLHEAEHNLTAAKEILGIDYAPDDVSGYFLGDYEYSKPNHVLVGLHAGSKGGVWGSKRWPYYEELAQRLHDRGVRVASFGTPDEYVPGTENRTGGTIEAMARSMLDCSHFVANDSGVMNVANALGIPLVALFAPTNVKTRGPLRKTSLSLAVEKECAPCELDRRPNSPFRKETCACIGDISIDEVLKSLNLPD